MATPDDRPALARTFGFNANEAELFGRLLVDGLGRSGIAAEPIVDRLMEGASIGQALGVPKGVAELLYARAHLWFAAGRHDRAEAIFRILCAIDPSSTDYWVGWGICLRMAERLAEAQIAFQTALDRDAGWIVPHFHMLELKIRMADWAAAAALLERCDALGTIDLTDTMDEQLARYRAVVAAHRTATRG